MYRLEIFTDQMEYASAAVVSKSQNIELDYLAYDAYSIETQLIDVKKGYFVHITQDNEFIADGIVSDVRPDKKTQQISIRPIQALFDAEVFYEPISSSIQWLADTITSYFISNSDTTQNRPIDLTYTMSSDSLSLIENFEDVGDTVNLLSVIETALKTYSVVVDTYLDMETLRVKCNIFQQTATKTLEADLENVLESEVTLGDSYGSINKAIVRKYDYVETTSGGETTKERRILGDFIYYRLSNDRIVRSTDSFDSSLRIFPVFWDLILIEKQSDQTDADWLKEAKAQATEVLTPQTYDQEIVLKYHKDDKVVRPMELQIGTIVTVYLKGETYTSILAAKRIEGNTVTLTLGAVRTELTKKLNMDRIGGGTSGGGGSGGGSSGGVPGPQGVGISTITQTTTSYVSEGENVITVTKTDGSSSTFSVRNGAQGAQGAAAGFGTPTATANTLAAGSSATASVLASGGSTAKVFNFTFGIPKGDKGDTGATGAAAGFANPTATAVTLSAGSSASASVSASGGNTMKQFDFTFGIPKGDTGATGPAGSSISSIARTSGTGESGTTDTYTITLTDGTTSTFQVKNGNDGVGITMREVTLTTSGWSNGSQTVNVSASVSNATDYLSIPDASTFGDYSGSNVQLSSVTPHEGNVDLTFTCGSVPPSDVKTVVLISTSVQIVEEYLNGLVTRAEEAMAHQPQIQNGVWYVWDVEDEQYESTGVSATGPQGPTGTAAGFGTPTATATTLSAGSSATASVTASGSNTSKVFAFTFGIPKGDKGDTGATGPKGDTGDTGPQGPTGTAAGFGTPTATVTTLSAGSSATASVTASGSNTSKVFAFNFGIPKGDKGDKGDTGDTGPQGAKGDTGDTGAAAGFGTPTASATTLSAGSSATASVTASGSNTSKVFNFSFGIPKGDTGAAGSSIQSIARTSGSGQSGETDTYTITLTNGNTTTFQVKNGNDGRGMAMKKVTLTSSGWSNNSQTVTINASASQATDFLAIPELETNDIYAGCGVKLSSTVPGDGTVACTFTCTTTPTSDVDAVILVSTSDSGIEEYLNGIVDDMTDLYNQTESDFNTASGLYVKKAGDTMTGPLKWSGSTALPSTTSASYFLVTDAFTSGGTTKYIGASNVKSSIGLGNVDNTSDLNKPISTATQTALDTKVNYYDTLFTTNPFAPDRLKKLYISKLDDGLYAADKRFSVSGTNGGTALTSSEIASLFDGNYDSQGIRIQNGNTAVITIDFSSLSDSKFPGYPYGDIIVSFYYVTKPASISGRVYNNYSSQGVGWKNLTFTAISDASSSQIWKARNDYYGLQTIELTIVGDTTNSYGYTSPVTIEFHMDRPDPRRTPIVSKYIPETLYYDLTAPNFIGNLTGNASTATKLNSAKTIQTNLASTAAVGFDGTQNINPGVTGTLPAGNGGTGKTTLIDAENAMLNALSTGSSTPVDADYYISQYVGGGTTTTTYHRRPMSALWEYIKGKISSVLGLSSTNYSGTAAKATADASGNNIKTTYLSGGSITVTPSTTTVNSITAVGTLPTLSFTPNSTTKNLAIAWSQGTLPTKGANTTVATGISSATFTGTHPS